MINELTSKILKFLLSQPNSVSKNSSEGDLSSYLKVVVSALSFTMLPYLTLCATSKTIPDYEAGVCSAVILRNYYLIFRFTTAFSSDQHVLCFRTKS
jgi:hypothetical protein